MNYHGMTDFLKAHGLSKVVDPVLVGRVTPDLGRRVGSGGGGSTQRFRMV